MWGGIVGVAVAKYVATNHVKFPLGPATLDFDHSPEDLGYIRTGRLPQSTTLLTDQARRRSRNAAKLTGAIAGLILALFGLLALTASSATNSSMTIMTIGVVFALVAVLLLHGSIWIPYRRASRDGTLEVTRAIARQSSEYIVTFGHGDLAPRWKLPVADYKAINIGHEYIVYHCIDVLIFLEEA